MFKVGISQKCRAADFPGLADIVKIRVPWYWYSYFRTYQLCNNYCTTIEQEVTTLKLQKHAISKPSGMYG
jgi:hypothetical protein